MKNEMSGMFPSFPLVWAGGFPRITLILIEHSCPSVHIAPLLSTIRLLALALFVLFPALFDTNTHAIMLDFYTSANNKNSVYFLLTQFQGFLHYGFCV